MRNVNVFIDKEYEKLNEPLCKSIIEKTLTHYKYTSYDVNVIFTSDVHLSDLKKVIDSISQTEINSILVEAGPKLVNSFIKNELCDQLIIYESNKELGDAGVPWFDSPNLIFPPGISYLFSLPVGFTSNTLPSFKKKPFADTSVSSGLIKI